MKYAVLTIILLVLVPGLAQGYHKIIVVDKSGSMSQPASKGTRVSRYQVTCRLILDEVRFDLADPINHVSLLFFDHSVYPASEIKSVREARKLLTRMRPGGHTNIGDTLHNILQILQRYRQEPYLALSLYTDGEETVKPSHTQQQMLQAFIRYCRARSCRTLLSVYHHRWDSQKNVEFLHFFQKIKAAIEGSKVDLRLEDNPDPASRSHLAAIMVAMPEDRLLVQSPPQLPSQLTLPLKFMLRASQLAVRKRVHFKIKPSFVNVGSPVGLELKGAKFYISKKTFVYQPRLEIRNLQHLQKHVPYEIAFEFVATTVNPEYFIQFFPQKVYATFTLSDKPEFFLQRPRPAVVRHEAKVGSWRQQALTFSWNRTASGRRVQFQLSPQLQQHGVSVYLSDAQGRRLTNSFYLRPSQGTQHCILYLHTRQAMAQEVTGQITFSAFEVTRSLQVQLIPRRGCLTLTFLTPTTVKLDRGQELVLKAALRLTPNEEAFGERYKLAVFSQPQVHCQIFEELEGDVEGNEMQVRSREAILLGLRFRYDCPWQKLQPAQNYIVVRPYQPEQLAVVDSQGQSPPAGRFQLPFEIVPYRPKCWAADAAVRTTLVKVGRAPVPLALSIAWNPDAYNRCIRILTAQAQEPFQLRIQRQKVLLPEQKKRLLRLPIKVAATAPGTGTAVVQVQAFGKALELRSALQAVQPQVLVRYTALKQPVPCGYWRPIGKLSLQARSPHTSDEKISLAWDLVNGVQVQLYDSQERAVNTKSFAVPAQPGHQLTFTIKACYDYTTLSAGALGPNQVHLRPCYPSLLLLHQNQTQKQITLPLKITPQPPRLAYLTYGRPYTQLDLGNYDPSQGQHFNSTVEPVKVQLKYASRIKAQLLPAEIWLQFDPHNLPITAMGFVASGQPRISLKDFMANPHFYLQFKPGLQRHNFRDQEFYGQFSLHSKAPIQWQNSTLHFKVTIAKKIKWSHLLIALLGVLLLGVAGYKAWPRGPRSMTGQLQVVGEDFPLPLTGQELYLQVQEGLLKLNPTPEEALAKLYLQDKTIWIAPIEECAAECAPVLLEGAPLTNPAPLYPGMQIELGGLKVLYQQAQPTAEDGTAPELFSPADEASPSSSADEGSQPSSEDDWFA